MSSNFSVRLRVVELNVHVVLSPPDSLTQGSRLLLPHVSTLLRYLSGVVRNTDRLKKKKFRAQVAKELNILSKSVKTYRMVHIQVFLLMCFLYALFFVSSNTFLNV